ncbi:MAG: DUF2232 domain-containing protein, partial [Leptolyngbyaceae cyanobacterium SM2_3_12]|nr:DUF2232 domain-containing protein [Leptolyngbyaceae cyanobacterium SM2_3_12]
MSQSVPDPAHPPGVNFSASAQGDPASSSQPGDASFDDLETYLDYQPPPTGVEPQLLTASEHRRKVGPLAMVETAFLASTAALIWLVNTYFPPGPILRILFPLPMALVYLRWG